MPCGAVNGFQTFVNTAIIIIIIIFIIILLNISLRLRLVCKINEIAQLVTLCSDHILVTYFQSFLESFIANKTLQHANDRRTLQKLKEI